MINQFNLYDKYASIYHAYNAIHRYMVCTKTIKDYFLLSTHTFIHTISNVSFYRKIVLIVVINIKVYFLHY